MVSLSQKTMLPFTAIEVGAMAARRALKLALVTGFHQIILEGDSQILISALENSSHSVSNFGHIVKDIQYLASCFSKIHYSHVRRHCNTVAHSQTGKFFISNASLNRGCTTKYYPCTSSRFKWPFLIDKFDLLSQKKKKNAIPPNIFSTCHVGQSYFFQVHNKNYSIAAFKT